VNEKGDDTKPVTVDGVLLYVQQKYRIDGGVVPEPITKLASIFISLLKEIYSEILKQPFKNINLTYLTTIRHDQLVSSQAEDGTIFFNLLAFQQQDCVDREAGEVKKEIRPWVYWLQRAVYATEKKMTKGLYNNEVRKRFKAYMVKKGIESPKRIIHYNTGVEH